MTLRIGSRGSDLALWQANHVANRLTEPGEIIIIKTAGDKIQHLSLDKVEGKGFFTTELETALLENQIDIAVHSHKDLPTEDPPGLKIAAVLPRGPVQDTLVMHPDWHDPNAAFEIKKNAIVGTSSLRRQAQLRTSLAEIELKPIRGNVPTRMQKILSEEVHAVVLAQAGIERLKLKEQSAYSNLVFHCLAVESACPPPAQGALAIQCRSDDTKTLDVLAPLHCQQTAEEIACERLLLSFFGGGCHLPLGAYARREGKTLILLATVDAPDGSEKLVAQIHGAIPEEIAEQARQELIKQGAEKYL